MSSSSRNRAHGRPDFRISSRSNRLANRTVYARSDLDKVRSLNKALRLLVTTSPSSCSSAWKKVPTSLLSFQRRTAFEGSSRIRPRADSHRRTDCWYLRSAILSLLYICGLTALARPTTNARTRASVPAGVLISTGTCKDSFKDQIPPGDALGFREVSREESFPDIFDGFGDDCKTAVDCIERN